MNIVKHYVWHFDHWKSLFWVASSLSGWSLQGGFACGIRFGIRFCLRFCLRLRCGFSGSRLCFWRLLRCGFSGSRLCFWRLLGACLRGCSRFLERRFFFCCAILFWFFFDFFFCMGRLCRAGRGQDGCCGSFLDTAALGRSRLLWRGSGLTAVPWILPRTLIRITMNDIGIHWAVWI